jgi:hypothetical protein
MNRATRRFFICILAVCMQFIPGQAALAAEQEFKGKIARS